ncbi:MAG: O-antigen ligase family protein, partial [Thermoanaerobaculia bacterium]
MLLRFFSRESTVGLALAALLFWAPLPAGSVTPGSELLFRLTALALAVMSLAAGSERRPRSSVLAVGALVAVAALGLLQSCSWPAGAAAIVSPGHEHLYRQAAELGGGSPPEWLPLSLDAAVSRSSAVSWLAAAALLSAVLVAGRRPRHRRWFLAALVGAALLQIGMGLIRLHLAFPAGLRSVLLRPEGRLRGTYANPNSLAFLLEMSLVVVAAWFWYALTRAAKRRRWLGVLAPLCLWAVLLAAVALTGSRAGLVAALLASVVQAAAVPSSRRGRRVAIAAVVAVLLGLGALIVVGSRLEVGRWETAS